MAKSKQRDGRTDSSRDQLPAELDALVQPLLESLPVPIDELPPELAELVGGAIEEGIKGNTWPLETLIEAIDAIEGVGGSTAGAEIELSSPAAAEILKDVDLFGDLDQARSIAQRALEIDPRSIDAHVILGMIAESPSDRIASFRKAAELAPSWPAENRRSAMPAARQLMARKLLGGGYLLEAAEILAPALEENPSDETDARYDLVEVYMRLGWETELEELCDLPLEDDLGPIDYARAILAFASDQNVRRANGLLRIADDRHPGLAALLVGLQPMPRAGDRIPMSDQRTYYAAEFLLPGLREFPGVVAWIRETLAERLSEDWGDEEAAEMLPADALGQAIEMPNNGRCWNLFVEKWDDRFAVMLTDEDQLIAADTAPQRPKTDALREFVLRAIVSDEGVPPGKPDRIITTTKATAKAITKWCGTFGVEVDSRRLAPPQRSQAKILAQMIVTQLPSPVGETEDDSAADRESVAALQQVDEVWVAGWFSPPMWIHERQPPRRGMMLLTLDVATGCIERVEIPQQFDIAERTDYVATFSRHLQLAMTSPAAGVPRRPQSVIFDPDSFLRFSSAHLDELQRELPDVELECGDDQTRDAFTALVAQFLLQQSPTAQAIADTEGFDQAELPQLYHTLANFYRVKPWKMVRGDAAFTIENPDWSKPRRVGSVTGQLGQQFGLVIYDREDTYSKMMHDQRCEQLDALVLEFDEAHEVVPVDLWYCERNGWEVAGDEAYPALVRYNTVHQVGELDAEDLRVLQTILPSLPRFLDHPRDEPFEIEAEGQVTTFRWLG